MGSWLCAIAFSVFFLATSLYVASRRFLWFDEINTLRVTQLPDLAALWRYQNGFRSDSAPIVYLLLVRLVYHLTGHADIAPRLLSALAMAVALLVVFDCARRLGGGTQGLVALCAMGTSFLTYYGYEGRPYALVVTFAAVALWLWLHTRVDSKFAAVAFGMAVFLATTMHYNGVLVLTPFAVWEMRHWRPWRKLSAKVTAGVVAAACAFAICLPQIRMATDAFTGSSSWCPPSVRALVYVYGEIFPLGVFVLAALGILVCLVRVSGGPMGDAERLCWLFLTIPIAGFFLAEFVTNAFYNRYLIAILPGVAVAFACLTFRCLARPASIAFLIFFAELAVIHQIGDVRSPETIESPSAPDEQLHTRQALAVEDALVADGRKAVISEFMHLQEMRYYSKRPGLYAIYEYDYPEHYCEFSGSACWDLDSIKAHAGEIAAFYPTPKLLGEMVQAGFQVIVKRTDPLIVYFLPTQKVQ